MRVRKLTLEALMRIVPRGCYKCRQGTYRTLVFQLPGYTSRPVGSEERRKLLKEQSKRSKYARPCSACMAKVTTEDA